MSVEQQNFTPDFANNFRIAGTGSASASQALAQPATPAAKFTQARIFNESTATAFVAWSMSGTATATASGANSLPVGPGATNTINTGGIASIAVILGTNTSAGGVYVTMGSGT